MPVNELSARLEKAIEDKRFNMFELKGFMDKPKLALMAGAAIGYSMALNDIAPTIKNLFVEALNAIRAKA